MLRSARTTLLLACLVGLACALPSSATAQTSDTTTTSNGGAGPSDPQYAPAGRARIRNGIAIPPADAPPEVRAVIEAGNKIIRKPYRYGGGHARLLDTGYDCSGTVSFALRGARALTGALPSGSLMSWGRPGRGKWITVYAHGGHAYVVIAGLRFDTSSAGAGGGSGPRWRSTGRSSRGFTARHPAGL